MRALLFCVATALAAPPPVHYSTFPPGTPSKTWADGPFLGNGVTGVGSVVLYFFALSGFWSSGYGTNSSMPPLADPAGSSFPGCPAKDCVITVGLTLATVEISSSALSAARHVERHV